MTMHPHATRTRGVLLAISFMAIPAFASAQIPSPAPTTALPDGKALLAEFGKAMGGQAAFDKIQSLHMSGTFEMPAMGMSGTVDTYSARPNKVFLAVNVGGFGDILSGSNGTVAWSSNPQTGASVLTGDNLKAAIEDADFTNTLRDPSRFVTVETVEKTTMDGRACYKVKVVRQSGRQTIDCFSPDTHLIVGSIDKQVTPDGELETITFVREYKQFDGIMIPVKLVINVAGMEQQVTIKTVDVNNVVDAKFDLPAEIKALIK